MADDERTRALTPTPQLSPAELADLALRLAMRIPAVRDANVAELIEVLERLRRHPSVTKSSGTVGTAPAGGPG